MCGYGNSAFTYMEKRLNEIKDSYKDTKTAIKHIFKYEIFLFDYNNGNVNITKNLIKYKYGITNPNVFHIEKGDTMTTYFYNLREYISLNNLPSQYDQIYMNPQQEHIVCFDNGLDMLSKKGRMVIIEPSSWLIKLGIDGDAVKKYSPLKDKLKGCVSKIVIENMNNIFKREDSMPYSITYIDKSKKHKEIEFICCGENSVVNNIYDCNLVGKYSTIQSILGKCQRYGDMMNDHRVDSNYCVRKQHYYVKYAEQCYSVMGTRSRYYFNDGTYNGTHSKALFERCIQGDLTRQCPKLEDERQTNYLYGTREELTNWKTYVLTNKLPLFINICMSINQWNNSKNYIPWFTKKVYSDAEIYKKLKLTNEEIKLIDKTIEKYDRKSMWFRRLMLGQKFE